MGLRSGLLLFSLEKSLLMTYSSINLTPVAISALTMSSRTYVLCLITRKLHETKYGKMVKVL